LADRLLECGPIGYIIEAAGKALRRKMWPVYASAIETAVGQHLTGTEAETLDELLGRLIEKAPWGQATG
jgi:hypothetical protein